MLQQFYLIQNSFTFFPSCQHGGTDYYQLLLRIVSFIITAKQYFYSILDIFFLQKLNNIYNKPLMNEGLEYNKLKYYSPYEITKSNHLTPDNPEFHSFPINLAILTKYGRFVFLRHGDENRCSSFCATLSTIVKKLELSFGTEENPASVKKIKQGILQFYVLKRMNFTYIFWSKTNYSDLRLYSMVEILHYQLMSCLTSKVNAIIDQNQTYDPTINFGKGPAVTNLLQYAFQNGLCSIPTLFNAVPILQLSNQIRTQINSILNVKQYKVEGLQISILLTMNSVVGISKQKSIDIQIKDIYLFFILLQAQSLLSKSENWFPICLPGIQPESMVFCYLSFIDTELIHIMISDESEIFGDLLKINKEVKLKLENANLIQRIRLSNNVDLIDNPLFEKSLIVKHFVVRNQSYQQMVMSQGQYFGDNSIYGSDHNFDEYYNIYGELYEHLLTVKHYRKQKLHVQSFKHYVGGYYQQGPLCIFFIISRLSDLQQAKNVIFGILKFIKEEEISIFSSKY